MEKLQAQIQAAIDASGAEMGVSLIHIESGMEININADDSFPMASVLKIPVLCAAFHTMATGAFTLDDRWELTYPLKNIGSGILTYLQDGLRPTVRDLLTLMIIISDNTATDMVMRRLGVAQIDALMKELGVGNIHLAFDIRGIFDDMFGQELADPKRYFGDWTKPRQFPASRRDGQAYKGGSHNNAATPRDMTRLCAMIYRGEVVDRAACDGMLHILLQQTLNQRLPRFLPAGIPFAHKTGTLSGIRNDAGVLYATERDHIAITVFSRWDAQAVGDDKGAEWARTEAIDSAFGHIGKVIYAHYTA
ncbi:MAG: serine hydrolase [Caldilineaceae bacterium]|nr:serine hydrolase [Caldilineaceae bacterium]